MIDSLIDMYCSTTTTTTTTTISVYTYVSCTEAFTADHKPLMGESPEVRGFFLGCGFNSSGMMLSKSHP